MTDIISAQEIPDVFSLLTASTSYSIENVRIVNKFIRAYKKCLPTYSPKNRNYNFQNHLAFFFSLKHDDEEVTNMRIEKYVKENMDGGYRYVDVNDLWAVGLVSCSKQYAVVYHECLLKSDNKGQIILRKNRYNNSNVCNTTNYSSIFDIKIYNATYARLKFENINNDGVFILELERMKNEGGGDREDLSSLFFTLSDVTKYNPLFIPYYNPPVIETDGKELQCYGYHFSNAARIAWYTLTDMCVTYFPSRQKVMAIHQGWGHGGIYDMKDIIIVEPKEGEK